MTALPATFMTGVSATYILMAKEGFRIKTAIAYPVGFALAVLLFVVYMIRMQQKKDKA